MPPCWHARALLRVAAPERAVQTEALRRLPEDTERDLREAGLFRIVQPKRVGGAELDYVALVDLAEEVAKADASVSWNLVNLGSHHWMLALFEPARRTRCGARIRTR